MRRISHLNAYLILVYSLLTMYIVGEIPVILVGHKNNLWLFFTEIGDTESFDIIEFVEFNILFS